MRAPPPPGARDIDRQHEARGYIIHAGQEPEYRWNGSLPFKPVEKRSELGQRDARDHQPDRPWLAIGSHRGEDDHGPRWQRFDRPGQSAAFVVEVVPASGAPKGAGELNLALQSAERTPQGGRTEIDRRSQATGSVAGDDVICQHHPVDPVVEPGRAGAMPGQPGFRGTWRCLCTVVGQVACDRSLLHRNRKVRRGLGFAEPHFETACVRGSGSRQIANPVQETIPAFASEQ